MNKNIAITSEYYYIIQENSILQYTLDYDLVRRRDITNILMKEYNSEYYLCIISDIVKLDTLDDLFDLPYLSKGEDIEDFHIYSSTGIFILNKKEKKGRVCFNKMYMYYTEGNVLYKRNLSTNITECIRKDVSIDYLYVHNDTIIWSDKQGKISILDTKDSIYLIRCLHKHDTQILNILLINNILYINTKDNKLSILELRRDNIKYLFTYMSPIVRSIKYKDILVLLTEYELILYDIKTGTYRVYYNIPKGDKVFEIGNNTKYDTRNDMNSSRYIIEPVYTKNISTNITNILLKYKNDIFILEGDTLNIQSIYNLKNKDIFYTGGYLYIISNNIEIYHINKDIVYSHSIKYIKGISDLICDLLQIEDIVYLIIKEGKKYKIYKQSIINICIQDEVEEYKILEDNIFIYKKGEIINLINNTRYTAFNIIDWYVDKDNIYLLRDRSIIKEEKEYKCICSYKKIYVYNKLIYLIKDNILDIYKVEDELRIERNYNNRGLIREMVNSNILVNERGEMIKIN